MSGNWYYTNQIKRHVNRTNPIWLVESRVSIPSCYKTLLRTDDKGVYTEYESKK